MALGRYKLSDSGAYFDPNDEGPDQASPDQIAALKGPSGSPSPAPPSGEPTINLDPAQSFGRGIAPPDYNPGSAGSTPIQTVQPLPSGDSFDPSKAVPNSGVNGGNTAQPAAAQPAQNYGAAPLGFDQAKWADPTQGTSQKYQVGRILAAGGSIQDAAAAVGAKVISPDKIQYPDGFIADVYYDYGGPQQRVQYTDVTGESGGGGGAAGSASAAAGGSLGGSSAGLPGSGAGSSGFSDQVRSLLMQQLGGLTGPVNADDPAIKAEMDAQGNVLERNRRDRRAADAERAAMNGLLNGGQSSGSFEQNIASGFEDKGQQLTGIQAQLFTREIQSRRAQISALLNMAMQSGDAESQRNLQWQLAQLDEAYRRMVHNDEFGLDAAKFGYEKDRDLAQYGAGY